MIHKLKYITLNTIIVNFKMLPLKHAIKLPLFISSNFIIKNLSGKITINGLIKPGMIKVGFGDIAIFDRKKSRGILFIQGSLIFNGSCFIGHGSKINCGPNALLVFGDNFNITAETTIIANHSITFGNNCLVSWENTIMDDDFHSIYNNGERINHPSSIKIGNRVWIGCRNLILKGSEIPDNTIIAAGSIISKKYSEPNCIIGGNPASILKKGIEWMK